jgi:hypothetical protein
VDELQGASDDVAIATVIALPELITKDGDRLGILAIGGIGFDKPSAEERRDAELTRGVARERVGTSSGRSRSVVVRFHSSVATMFSSAFE